MNEPIHFEVARLQGKKRLYEIGTVSLEKNKELLQLMKQITLRQSQNSDVETIANIRGIVLRRHQP